MFFLLRPSDHTIERFIDKSRELQLSYSPAGLLRDETAGRNLDEAVVAIGRGKADFERSRTALAAWKQFDMGWVELFPRGASVEPGTNSRRSHPPSRVLVLKRGPRRLWSG